ncbi:hypothetical protein A3I95_01790 [Candidatus Nomurabacteria bacterium RIFCSPLOWO2_02_FULL_44_12]|uniref:Uncharacterized protein n=1 Tax=Candidatus Nomurabacteria bacterium RIFCSPLOWO2_12_FULL_44_11 TaxID=1801796 RepID=A0A1F6Y6D6_9BACT|nr:MAG: hypothetical protein A3E95_01360 [Candidatus Nomurabacteria bacterium RIFCSPHIGHO2_12_FULL_44_22b]OGJ01950.1 MAG: hypothetical protein A3G53_01535 [Candidatus Nomurabacteria bacterium RIFCSPLOWO2_12_FULL_44_11]OGJ08607.1 MAG: hypothetical protein A3I95_01790 [Candidatus Nomurabacteria bacterium RIFCSPLOWO2_02_FULL_44_12]
MTEVDFRKMAGSLAEDAAAHALASALNAASEGHYVFDSLGVKRASWVKSKGGWIIHDRGWALSGQISDDILESAIGRLGGRNQSERGYHRRLILAAARASYEYDRRACQ